MSATRTAVQRSTAAWSRPLTRPGLFLLPTPILLTLRDRSYHSYDHPPTSRLFSPAEEAILAAAYHYVPSNGFTNRALGLGARDAGYLDISPSILPGGPFSLIRYHLVTQRWHLAEADKQNQEGQQRGPSHRSAASVADRITSLTWSRLMGNKDIIQHWQEALSTMAQPSYLPTSLKELAMLSDEIWFLSGDTSVDQSWYTKRASLSMIYSSSELFMTNDRSPDFLDTRKFLHRRLDEVQSVGGAIQSAGQWIGFTMSAGVNVLRSKGVRI